MEPATRALASPCRTASIKRYGLSAGRGRASGAEEHGCSRRRNERGSDLGRCVRREDGGVQGVYVVGLDCKTPAWKGGSRGLPESQCATGCCGLGIPTWVRRWRPRPRRRLWRRRSSSVIPPQIPYGSSVARAWSRHSDSAGQSRQMDCALVWRCCRADSRSPSGAKNIEASASRHAAVAAQIGWWVKDSTWEWGEDGVSLTGTPSDLEYEGAVPTRCNRRSRGA